MPSIQDWVASAAAGVNLGPQATRVIEVIKTHPQLAAYASTAEIAERAAVNVATVVRAVQGLGFTGWTDFRLELRGRYLASLSGSEILTVHGGSLGEPIMDAIRQDVEHLETLSRTIDVAAIRDVAAAMNAAGRIVVVGSGSFAAPGVQLVHIGAAMGLDIRLERHGGTQLANAVTGLRSGDCLVVVNMWWLPREVLAAARLARERGVLVCVITDRTTSALATTASHRVIVPSEGVATFPSLTPAMAVVHAILAQLVHLGGDAVRAAIRDTEEVWSRMNLFDETR